MEKLKLPVESLEVETFDTGDAGRPEGTVQGHEVSAPAACCTRRGTGCPDVTTIFTGNCC
jgi:hypothetical protein